MFLSTSTSSHCKKPKTLSHTNKCLNCAKLIEKIHNILYANKKHFDLLYLLITVVPMGVQTFHSRMSRNPFKNKIFKEKHQFMLL